MTTTDQTIVFDFDHTLTSWDSADRFFRWLLKRNPWRMALVVISLPVLGPMFLARRTRKLPIRYAVWVATLGQSLESLQFLAKQHVKEIMASGRPLLMQDGSRRLRHHHELGHTVVIATGSLESLAREFLDQSGFGHIPLVGSSLKPFLWGLVSEERCYAENKIPLLTRRGFPPPWSMTYTDHQCDLPVIGHSATCFLVNPKPKAIRLISRKLSFTPEILSWR
jgi:phosphatidylglycerophosphatase C